MQDNILILCAKMFCQNSAKSRIFNQDLYKMKKRKVPSNAKEQLFTVVFVRRKGRDSN